MYILSAVPTVLKETLPVTSRTIQSDLGVTQSLAWKYTAILERLTGPAALPTESDLPTQLLKQALYNTRQHEAFLKLLLVREQIVLIRICVTV